MNGRLIAILREGRHSLVIDHGGVIRTFDGRGIADLYALLNDGRDCFAELRLPTRSWAKVPRP